MLAAHCTNVSTLFYKILVGAYFSQNQYELVNINDGGFKNAALKKKVFIALPLLKNNTSEHDDCFCAISCIYPHKSKEGGANSNNRR